MPNDVRRMKPFEIFYSFPSLKMLRDSLIVQQAIVPALRRRIDTLIRESPGLTEAFLAKHLLTLLQQSTHQVWVQQHLSAFLANLSQDVVWRVRSSLQFRQKAIADMNTFSQDLFQIALEIALNPTEFFKPFEIQRSDDVFWYAALKRYSRCRIQGQIYDQLRKVEGLKTLMRSDLYLAAQSSEKRVTESLRFDGRVEPEITQMILAWKCFREVKQAEDIESKNLGSKHFKAIADRYNRLRAALPRDIAQNPAMDGPQMERWLKQIGTAVRHYIDRPSDSLEQLYGNLSSNSGTGSENLVDSASMVGLDYLLMQESNQVIADSQNWINHYLAKLHPQSQILLFLIDGWQLVQMEASDELKKHQATISRQYNKILHELVALLVQQLQQQIELKLTLENLSNLKVFAEEQVQSYYQRLAQKIFQATFQKLSEFQREILRIRYSEGLSKEDIADHLQQPVEQINDLLFNLQTATFYDVTQQLQQHWQVQLKPQGAAYTKFVDQLPHWTVQQLPHSPHSMLPFEQWAAVIAKNQELQWLYQRRLAALKTEKLTRVTNLWNWLHQNWLEAAQDGWRSMSTFLEPEPLQLMSAVRSMHGNSTESVQLGKLIKLNTQLAEIAVLLRVAVAPEPNDKVGVLIQVHPGEEERHLPPNLSLSLLIDSQVIQSVSRPQDAYIEFPYLRCPLGTQFQLQLQLGNTSVIEEFEIVQDKAF